MPHDLRKRRSHAALRARVQRLCIVQFRQAVAPCAEQAIADHERVDLSPTVMSVAPSLSRILRSWTTVGYVNAAVASRRSRPWWLRDVAARSRLASAEAEAP